MRKFVWLVWGYEVTGVDETVFGARKHVLVGVGEATYNRIVWCGVPRALSYPEPLHNLLKCEVQFAPYTALSFCGDPAEPDIVNPDVAL